MAKGMADAARDCNDVFPGCLQPGMKVESAREKTTRRRT
jgi:hypothetical protein